MEKNPVAATDDRATALRRMRRLSLHLAEPSLLPAASQLATVPCARAKRVSVANSAAFAAYMRGKHWDVQVSVFEFFRSCPDLHTPIEISMADHRELCLWQLRALVREGGVSPFRYVFEDPGVYFAIVEAAGGVDMSLGIKMGVQYSLWGGSVINLGTQKHREKFFGGIDNLDYPGCFAMTELHHAGNRQST